MNTNLNKYTKKESYLPHNFKLELREIIVLQYFKASSSSYY